MVRPIVPLMPTADMTSNTTRIIFGCSRTCGVGTESNCIRNGKKTKGKISVVRIRLGSGWVGPVGAHASIRAPLRGGMRSDRSAVPVSGSGSRGGRGQPGGANSKVADAALRQKKTETRLETRPEGNHKKEKVSYVAGRIQTSNPTWRIICKQ